MPPPEQDLPMLQLEQLSFAYDTQRVVDNWSATLAPGASWLQGPNGCGKSTRLKLLGAVLQPQCGQARLGTLELRRDAQAWRRQTAWVGAEGAPLPHLSPRQLFAFLAGLYGVHDEAHWRDWSATSTALGLTRWLDQALHSLSTGTQRKAALAAALSLDVPLLLLDEPFNALDEQAAAALRQRLQQRHQDAARWTVMASHEDPALSPLQTLQLQA
ncbi:ATP-binding cassette domain-containing protein [Roseateles sp. BYS180W]|uniref:ATP-binding cassette domain-containing protein n=1 Tax=Roseateles rivi TaxID=3299028 RepID=A0ABW7FTJ2_9BURK